MGPKLPAAPVRDGRHQGEVLIQLHVDLMAVGKRHLDLVIALLVTDLGLGDRSAAGGGPANAVAALSATAPAAIHLMVLLIAHVLCARSRPARRRW